MAEKEFTYKGLLKKIPRRKAPDEVWDRLQTSMFSIDYSDIPLHNPPVYLWKKIRKSQHKIIAKRQVFKWTSAILLLLTLVMGSYFIFNSTRQDIGQKNTNRTVKSVNKPLINKSEIERQEYVAIPKMTSIESVSVQKRQNFIKKQKRYSGIKEYFPEKLRAENREINTLVFKNSQFINKKKAKLPVLNNKIDDCSPFRSNHLLYIGLSYEYTFIPKTHEYKNTAIESWQSLFFNTKLKRNRFFLETGVGLTLSKDKISWTYDYLKNELVNTYVYVDSIYYDPTTGETFYYTSTVKVYDSVSYSANKISERKQVYFSLPLMAGFELYKRKRCNLSAQGGFINHFLVSSGEIQYNPSEPNARITDVHFLRTKRVNNLFSLHARINFEWKMNRKYSIYLYPSINYYTSPFYEDAVLNKPFSLGFGLGVFF